MSRRRVVAIAGTALLVACGNNSSPAGTDPGTQDASANGDGGHGGDAALAPDSGAGAHDASSDAPVAATEGGPDGSTEAGAPAVRALGYYTGDQASYDAITAFHAYLTMVSADLYDVKTDGSIVGSDGLNVLANTKSHAIDAFACLSNYSDPLGDFDPALGHAAMVTNEAIVVANAVKLASSGYRGLNVDFEGIAYSANVADDRSAYTKFITDLSTQLHAKGLELVISVPAKTADSATDTWTYPYDFSALGPIVDSLQLMTYDENGPGWSAPGPVSGADWVKSCVDYATTVVAPAKILIGLPAYGYDWDLTASSPAKNTYVGTSVAWTGIAALLATKGAVPHWDATTSSPYVDYTSADGHMHEAWYENPQSIQAKTAIVKTAGLGGLSMWALGDEDATFWQAAYAGLK